MKDWTVEILFARIVNMSLTASVAVAALCLARLALRRVPRIVLYALWAVVLFRFLCPVSLSSGLSLYRALPGGESVFGSMEYLPLEPGRRTDENTAGTAPPGETKAAAGVLANAGGAAQAQPQKAETGTAAWPEWLAGSLPWASRLWLLGCAVFAADGARSFWRLRRRLKQAVWERENIYRLPGKGTPFVCGILRPRIYIPGHFSAQEEAYLLQHERIHIRRGDPVFRLLAYAALCIHWFNPLAWLAFSLSGRDMEISCDEAVLGQMGGEVKKGYCASLLALSHAGQPGRRLPVAFGEGDTGVRIRRALRYKKPAAILTAAAALVGLALAASLLTNPSANGGGTSAGHGSLAGTSAADDGSPAGTAAEEQATFYGVIDYVDVGADTAAMAVLIPRIGAVQIPKAEEVEPYIEIDFHGLEEGDLVQITFPRGVEPLIMETYPSMFAQEAERIAVIGRGLFEMVWQENGNILFTIPQGLAMEAQPGDTLLLYRSVPGADGTEEELFASAQVLEVVGEKYQIWVELPPEAVEMFMEEFIWGIRAETAASPTGTDGR